MSTLVVELVQQQGVAVLKVVGEARLQLADFERQVMKLTAGRPAVVVVDATGLTFCSSLGMGTLVSLSTGLRRHGGLVRLVGLQPLVMESFKKSGLVNLFETFPTLEAALAGNVAT